MIGVWDGAWITNTITFRSLSQFLPRSALCEDVSGQRGEREEREGKGFASRVERIHGHYSLTVVLTSDTQV